MSFLLHEVIVWRIWSYYANVIDVGCILRSLRALHNRRRNTIFSQMEATTYKDAYTADTLQEQWECTKAVLLSYFTVELPTLSSSCLLTWSFSRLFLKIWLFHPVAETFGMTTCFPLVEGCGSTKFVFSSLRTFFSLLGYVLPCKHLPFWPWCDVACFSMQFSPPSAPYQVYITSTLHLLVLYMPIPLILGTGTIGGPILSTLTVVMMGSLALCQLNQGRMINGHISHGRSNTFSLFWSGAEHHDFHHMAFTNSTSFAIRWKPIVTSRLSPSEKLIIGT